MSKRRSFNNVVQKAKIFHCIFCAAPCPPTFSICSGQVKRLKKDVPPNGKGAGQKTQTPVPTLTFLEDEECSSLAAQLKVLFILKNILEIEEEKFHKFLGVLEGQFHPEFWIQTCGYCGEAVRVCYETVKEISRLEKKFKSIKKELKGRIGETKEETGGGQDEEVGSVWKEIRQEVLDKQGFQESSKSEHDDADAADDVIVPQIPSHGKFKDEEDDEQAIDDFLNGSPPPLPDDDPLSMGHPTNRKEKSHSSKKPRLNFKSEDTHQVKFHRQRQAKNHNDDDDDSATDTDIELQEKDTQIYINGNIFEDENDDDDDEDDFQLDFGFELEQNEAGLNKEGSTSKDEERKGRKQKLVPILASPDIQLIPPPVIKEKPEFTPIRRGQRTLYQCMQCPAIFTKRPAIFEHLDLHRPGSSSITCPTPSCYWTLDPEKLAHHDVYKHRPIRPPTEVKKIDEKPCNNWKYFKCAECDALFGKLKRLRRHWELHDKGGGVVCNECGWLCLSMLNHNTFWHPKEGGKHAEMRMRTAHREIVTLQRGYQPEPRCRPRGASEGVLYCKL